MPVPATVLPAYLGLGTFLRYYLACSPYNSIILVHDASTRDLATASLAIASEAPLSHWLTFNVDTYQVPSELGHCARVMLNDTEALFVWLVPESQRLTSDLQRFRRRLAANEHCDNLLLLWGSAATADIHELLEYVRQERIVNIALVQNAQADTVDVFKLNYDFFAAMPYYAETSHCARKLFYDKTIEWRTRELLMFMFFKPPNVINLTRSDGSVNAQGAAMFNVGGCYANLAALVNEKLGTRIQNVAIHKSKQWRHRPDLARFIREYLEKAYREDRREPRCLGYRLLDKEDWPAYTANRTVISFEEEISTPSGMHSLYPHAFDRFILCVPNQVQEHSTWWTSLFSFPLIYVWSVVIAFIAVLRTALRRLQGLHGQSGADIVFHTCGISFGEMTSHGVKNRPERVLLLFLSVFTMVSGILCAGLLFQKFTTKVVEAGIDSLEQLGRRRHLDVWMPDDFAPETEQWLSEQIPNRIIRLDMFMIQSMIYAKNISAAYIVSEPTIDILLKRPEMLDDRGYNVFHQIRFTIVRQQVRFVVPAWYMIRRLNTLLRQTTEHGFVKSFEMRTEGIMQLWRTEGGGTPFNDNALAMLPMEELLFVFVIYALGVMVSLVTFVAEHVRYRLQRRRKFTTDCIKYLVQSTLCRID